MSSNNRMGTIEAHLAEQEYYKPSKEFIEQANVKSADIYERLDKFPDGFEEYANLLDWYETVSYTHQTLPTIYSV